MESNTPDQMRPAVDTRRLPLPFPLIYLLDSPGIVVPLGPAEWCASQFKESTNEKSERAVNAKHDDKWSWRGVGDRMQQQ